MSASLHKEEETKVPSGSGGGVATTVNAGSNVENAPLVPYVLEEEEWRDPQILQLVQSARTWQEGNEPSVKTVVPFIYNLMEKAYILFTDRAGEERKRIVLAVLLHSLETKPDWSSPEERDSVMMIVRKAGAVILNFGSINIKEKALNAIREIKETIDDIKEACGCIPKP